MGRYRWFGPAMMSIVALRHCMRCYIPVWYGPSWSELFLFWWGYDELLCSWVMGRCRWWASYDVTWSFEMLHGALILHPIMESSWSTTTTTSLQDHITTSPHYYIILATTWNTTTTTTSPHNHPYITIQLHHYISTLLHHHITTSLHNYITTTTTSLLSFWDDTVTVLWILWTIIVFYCSWMIGRCRWVGPAGMSMMALRCCMESFRDTLRSWIWDYEKVSIAELTAELQTSWITIRSSWLW